MNNNGKLTTILLDLHKSCRSGVLRVEKGKAKKQLVLARGLLAFAESNLPEEHLAKVMVKQNLLQSSRMKEIASLMKEGKSSEEAIIALPNANVPDVEKGRREQAISILSSFWTWAEYDLRFYAGENLIRSKINLGIPLPEALILSVRHAVSSRLFPAPGNLMQGSFVPVQELEGKAAELPLSTAESTIFSMVRQPMDMVDLLAHIPAGLEKAEEPILCLSAMGLIKFQEPQQQPQNVSPEEAMYQSLEDMLMRLENANHYEILAVSPKASPDEIQVAYHDLAKQFHPDRFQSKEFASEIHHKAQRLFSSINEAYFTLKSSDSREAYDAQLLAKTAKSDSDTKAKAAADQQTAETLFQAGRALILRGEFEKAIERLRGCVWLRPEKAVYHHYLGVAQSRMQQFRKEAEQHFLKAIELDAMTTESRLELARLYMQVHLRRKAELQLQELLHWDPQNREAQKLLDELVNAPR